jgi:autoinducer 2-degrading protein
MFVLLVEVEVRPERLEAFEAAILENAARSVERDPGCLRFDVSQHRDDPTRWIFHEVYTDEAAHAAHKQSAHFAAYSEVADRAIVTKTLTRCTGKRLNP